MNSGYIDPQRVRMLLPALRSLSVPNFPKSFLQVQSIGDGAKAKNGWTALTDFGEGGATHSGKTPIFYFERVYTHSLPLTVLECTAALQADIVQFEELIGEQLLDTLRPSLRSRNFVEDESYEKTYKKARALLEDAGLSAGGLYTERGTFVPPHKVFSPRQWSHPKSYFVVTSDQKNTGLMLTSPLDVELQVEIPVVTLKLAKKLGFSVNPSALIECAVNTGGK